MSPVGHSGDPPPGFTPGPTYLVQQGLFSNRQVQKGIGRRREPPPRGGRSPPWWRFQVLWDSAPPAPLPPSPARTESLCFPIYSFSVKRIFATLNLWNPTIHIKHVRSWLITICPVKTHFFSEPQQVREKVPELTKNYELSSAKIMTFSPYILPIWNQLTSRL